MNRFRITIAAALFAFVLGAAAAQTPPARDIFLPQVSNGSAPSTSVVLLLDGDNSEVSSAVAPAGCTFVAVIRRDHGNVIQLYREDGDTLIDVPMPEEIQVFDDGAPGLAFVAPGAKHASMNLLITGDVMELRYTSRPPQATTGGFHLYRLRMPVPSCQ